MKITSIETTNLRFAYPPGHGFRYSGGVATGRLTSIVRVDTDAGLVGWGSAYSHPTLVQVIVDHLRPFLIGQDARDSEALWDKMYALTRWYGRKGAALSALGALDVAFWDLRGKEAGLPVYRLLGGGRPAVPAYGSALLWAPPAVLAADARALRAGGFRRVKMRLGRSPAEDVEAFGAVREAVGPDIEVLVDGSHRYTLETALPIADLIGAAGAGWFEEPFPPEDLASYVALRRRGHVPIAAGENEFGRLGFRQLIDASAIDIAQPDASRSGGITECVRIGRMAEAAGLRVAPHTWSDAIAIMANAHVVAALEAGLTVELDRTGNPFIDELLVDPLPFRDGHLHLGDRPGLGIEVREEALARYALPAGAPIPDGSYSDLSFGAAHWTPAPPYR